MSLKISLAVSVGVIMIAGIFYASSANAQDASASSLADQLKAQYKLAKIVPESDGYKVAEPGTMLVIQKDGIFGVPMGSNSVDPVIYAIQKDTDLHHSDAGASTWKFGVGHKVYLSKIDIDAKHEKVLFTIVECDSSNLAKPSYYKSVVDFEFPNGYLAAAEVGQIEDVISQVLTIDSGNNDPQPAHGAQSSPASLTNDEIVKLVQAKLGDGIIISTIKSATSSFDTSINGMVKLKEAGVSDSVIQAMRDAQEAAKDATPATQEPLPEVDCDNYDSCMKSGTVSLELSKGAKALAEYQQASQLDPSKGEAWAGMGDAYFQMDQYDDAFSAWDNALRLGATLSAPVCHEGFLCGTGNFLLNAKEVFFINRKGEKELSAAPSAVTSEGPVLFAWSADAAQRPLGYYLQIKFEKKKQRFRYRTKIAGCNPVTAACREPGPTQQREFANYIHSALIRMAAGEFGLRPSKP
jgi:tetratricopeptide (TPR) repeat protein